MRSWRLAAAWLAMVCTQITVLAEQFLDNTTEPLSKYYTRPQSMSPALNVIISQPGQADGYIFLGPYSAGYRGSGPRIYDKQGNLIWDGYGIVPGPTHNVHLCQYKGEPHLCMVQCVIPVGYGVGQGLILDRDYKIVKTVQTGRGATPVDQHEFQLVDDGEKALVSFYQTVPFDLSPLTITGGLGYVMESGFQEIDVESGDVLFEWYSLDHVGLLDTKIVPNSSDTSGLGTSGTSGFDYFHLNSVDESPDSGNFLISARHTSTIYLINATDQSIIWRLSSQGTSDFTPDFTFSYQHDARFLSENDTTTIISFFDNASNGYNHDLDTYPLSSGRIIALNHESNTATLLSATLPPLSTISNSQGNSQVLPNGNVFNGWGDVPAISEHAPDGTVLLAASWAPNPGSIMNYRAFSFDGWESTPANTVPSVYAYALNDTAPTYIYASWNGATTVKTWRYYGAAVVGDDFEQIGETDKDGFETLWTSPEFRRWWLVEAVAEDGTGLRNSSFQPTFTPSEALMAACTESGCAELPDQGVYFAPGGSVYRGTS